MTGARVPAKPLPVEGPIANQLRDRQSLHALSDEVPAGERADRESPPRSPSRFTSRGKVKDKEQRRTRSNEEQRAVNR